MVLSLFLVMIVLMLTVLCVNTMSLHILHRVGHTRVIKCSAHTVVPSKCLPEHDDYACVAMEASTCVNHRCSTAENNCLGAIGYYATLHAHEKPSSTDTTNAFIRYHTVVVHTTYPDSRRRAPQSTGKRRPHRRTQACCNGFRGAAARRARGASVPSRSHPKSLPSRMLQPDLPAAALQARRPARRGW